MTALVLLLLAQPASLNLNMQPIEVRDEGVRQGTTRAYAINCSGTGVTCTNSAGVMTLTASGGGSPTVTCAADEALTWNGSAWACISKVRAAYMADAGLTAAALESNPTDCGANTYANAIAANGNLTCAQVAYSQLSGAPTIPTDISGEGYWVKTASGNLSNEVAMGALGTGLVINTATTGIPTIKGSNTCTNQFPRSDNASGTWTCASIATADLPTVTVGKGGTGQTTITTNQLFVGTALDTLTAKTLPSCSGATTDKLLYDNATQTFSCGADQGGAGGGISFAEAAAARLAGAF